MCTGFIKKGKDILFGFNLDIDLNVWNFKIFKTKTTFAIGIKVGQTLYYTHGVNSKGHFGNLPYMNGKDCTPHRSSPNKERIDLLTNRYIRNQYTYDDVLGIVKTKTIVNIPNNSLHSLFGDEEGHILLVEPGYGYQEIKASFAVITNFPILSKIEEENPFFGKDRYQKAVERLANSDESFSPLDGIALLKEVKQEGPWATRVSFVYSVNEKCVYYVVDNDYHNIQKHFFD
ncbi:MAG: conjugal transfer protein [Bacilli bacterium]|nr:conjugal transfer protein [Bacilli bacterium]